MLRALALFDRFKAFPAETEMVKFCLKCAGCFHTQRDEMSKSSSAWSSLPQTFMFVHLNTKTRFFFVAHVWIYPECFRFSHPVQGKENQRGSSSFPQPSLSCPVMLMLHEVFSKAIAAQNLFGALGLLFSGYIKSFL